MTHDLGIDPSDFVVDPMGDNGVRITRENLPWFILGIGVTLGVAGIVWLVLGL